MRGTAIPVDTSPHAGKIYRIYTVENGKVEEGADIEYYRLSSAKVVIPVISVGQKTGNGCYRVAIKVARLQGDPCPNRNRIYSIKPEHPCRCRTEIVEEVLEAGSKRFRHPDLGIIYDSRVYQGEVTTNFKGNLVLLNGFGKSSPEQAIVVCRTHFGHRGRNFHTGDRKTWTCQHCHYASTEYPVPFKCPGCHKKLAASGFQEFEPFPGVRLLTGRCSEGDSEKLGCGEQLIALIPRGAVFRTAYSGSLYGKPSEHYYRFDGKNLQSSTWEERVSTQVF